MTVKDTEKLKGNFTAFIVKDLKKHKYAHYELHDFTHTSKRMSAFKTQMRWGWLRIRYDGDRYSIQVSGYNSVAAFHHTNPSLTYSRGASKKP